MGALSTIREPDGVTLDLSEPVRDQISDGVLRLVAEATPDRVAASTSPPGDEESSAADGAAAQPNPDQPEAKAGSEAAKGLQPRKRMRVPANLSSRTIAARATHATYRSPTRR